MRRAAGRRGAPFHVLERTQHVAVEPARAFDFFASAANLEAITPPWLRFRIVEAPPRLEEGALIRYRLRLAGLPIGWLTRITSWLPPRCFTDEQVRGPYRLWVHTHRLTPVADGTEIYDHVLYRLPAEPFASLVRPLTVQRWLDEIFDHRAERVAALLG